MRNKESRIIVLEVESTKPLSRKRVARIRLSWTDPLRLPITGDKVTVGKYELEVARAPALDEMLLDQPSEALRLAEARGPVHWYCRYGVEWIRVEALIAGMSADPRYLDAQVLP